MSEREDQDLTITDVRPVPGRKMPQRHCKQSLHPSSEPVSPVPDSKITVEKMKGASSNGVDTADKSHPSDCDWKEGSGKKRPAPSTAKSRQKSIGVLVPRAGDNQPGSATANDSEATKQEQKQGRRRKLTPQQAWKKIDTLGEELQDVKDKLARSRERRRELKDEEQIKYQRLKEATQKAKESEAHLQIQLDKAGDQILRLEEELQKLQAEQLERMPKLDHAAHGDRWLVTNLGKIFQESKRWSRTWTLPQWSSEDYMELQRAVEESAEQDSMPLATSQACDAIGNGCVPPWIVVNTVLNAFLCSATFDSPFACLKKSTHSDSGRLDVESVLRRVVESAKKGSPAAGNTMRASILRALDAPVLEETERDCLPPLAPSMQESIKSACRDMLGTFIGRYGRAFHHVTHAISKVRNKQLLEIFEAAMGLSTSLATQNPEIQVSFLHKMSTERFSLEHPKLNAHRLMGIKEDSNDEDGLDPREIGIHGQPIDIVVEPMVVRIGDEEGSNYNIQKILKKAVVWMVQEKDFVVIQQVLRERTMQAPTTGYPTSQGMPQLCIPSAATQQATQAGSPASSNVRAADEQVSAPQSQSPNTDGQHGSAKRKRLSGEGESKHEPDNTGRRKPQEIGESQCIPAEPRSPSSSPLTPLSTTPEFAFDEHESRAIKDESRVSGDTSWNIYDIPAHARYGWGELHPSMKGDIEDDDARSVQDSPLEGRTTKAEYGRQDKKVKLEHFD